MLKIGEKQNLGSLAGNILSHNIMANLNPHDIVFLNSSEFKGFEEKIEHEYGLKILSTTLPEIVSFTSKKLILYTSSGNFFLKEKPEYCSDELSLRRAAHFQEYASSQLDTVPQILMTKGKDFYIQWNRKHYFLAEYRKGRHYNGSQKDLTAMINALATFQRCGTAYHIEYQNLRPEEHSLFESLDVARGIPDVKAKIETEDDRKVFEDILLLFDNFRTEYIDIPKGEYVMAHSDFILFNLILNEVGVVAINDFDNAKVLPRVHDMAEFLVSATLLNYVAPLTNLKLPISFEPEKESFRYILSKFKSDFMLTQNEVNLLGTIAEIIWLWTLVLAVFKGDYCISDLSPAVTTLRRRQVKNLIYNFYS